MHPTSGKSAFESTVAHREPEHDDGPDALASLAPLGRYIVIEPVGSGGMGVVYRAYDPSLRREVAVKVLRRSRGDSDAAARMVREAQSMARLSHPNVVAVYDVIIEGNEVMLVMEFVAGTTLRDWLTSAPRSPAQILACFVDAGRGLAAAHAAGLLHRDFKPSNVLVSDNGRAKVTDFGLALHWGEVGLRSETEPSTSEHSQETSDPSADRLTQTGVVLGTPAFMAPEQHLGSMVDARADQYAFCVALWHALCRAYPYEGSERDGAGGLLRAKMQGPPPWPKHTTAPRRIIEVIRRGLEPKIDARWPTMDALLDALTPGSSRRTRALLSVAAAGMTAAGSLGLWFATTDDDCEAATHRMDSVWNADRQDALVQVLARPEVPYGAETAKWVDTTVREYVEAWTAQRRDACEATLVRREQSQSVLDLRAACLDRAAVELDAALVELEEGDVEVIQRASDLLYGLAPLSRCANVEALLGDLPPPSDPAVAAAVEEARGELARVRAEINAGRYHAAVTRATALQQRAATIGHRPFEVEVELELGVANDRSGQYEDAERILREVLRTALSLPAPEIAADAASQLAMVVGVRGGREREGRWLSEVAMGLIESRTPRSKLAATVRTIHANVLEAEGELAQSEAIHREVLQMRIELLGPQHPDVGFSRGNLAGVLAKQGRHAEAETEHRENLRMRVEVLGPGHPDVANSYNELAIALLDQKRYGEAEQAYLEGLRLRRAALGPDHPDVGQSLYNLGHLMDEQGRYDDAVQYYRQALAVQTKQLGIADPEVAQSLNGLANALHGAGKPELALAEHREALRLRLTELGPEHRDVTQSRYNIANTLEDLDRHREAEAEYRAVISSMQHHHPDDAFLGAAHGGLGNALMGQKRFAEAEAEYRVALQLREVVVGSDHPEISALSQAVGEAAMARGDHGAARSALARAFELAEKRPRDAGEAAWALGKLELAAGRRAEAKRWAAEAEQRFGAIEASSARTERLRELSSWRAAQGV